MLVLHPSSRCDVCLDAYTFETPSQTPHAIPCGHIFCQTCLHAVVPSNCPLCRKTFLPGRAKKLHVDRPESLDEHREIDLLQRLALSWESPEDHLAELMNEVEGWLQTRNDDASIPLRKAREALTKYQKLKDSRQKDGRIIKILEETLHHHERHAVVDRETNHAVEQSLLEQLQELETKIAQYEVEVEKLRADLARYKYTRNPLPPPPEPIPLDRFPSFARAVAAAGESIYSDTASLYPASSSSSSYRQPYISGPSNGHSSDRGHGSDPSISLHEDDAAPRDRKGKGKERDGLRNPLYGTPRHPSSSAQSGLSTRIQEADVLPGATPTRRVVPPGDAATNDGSAQWTDSTVAGIWTPGNVRGEVSPSRDFDADSVGGLVNGYELATAYITEYASGYGEGYEIATRPPTSNAHSLGSDRSSGLDSLDQLRSVLQDPSPNQNASMEPRRLLLMGPLEEQLEDEQGPLAVSTIPVPPAMTHWRMEDRTATIRPTPRARGSLLTMADTTPQPAAEPAPIARRTSTRQATAVPTAVPPRARDDGRRNSTDSWGTVETSHTARLSTTSSVSISQLGLRSLEEGVLGPRSSTASEASLPPADRFPIRDISDDGGSDRHVDSRTPRVTRNRVVSTPVSTLLGVRPVAQASEARHRERRTPSHSALTMQLQTTAQRPRHTQAPVIQGPAVPDNTTPVPTHRTRHQEPSSSRRHRVSSGRRPSMTSFVEASSGHYPPASAPPDQITFREVQGYQTDGLEVGGYQTDWSPVPSYAGNALGLDLNIASGPIPISAPTPIVSSRAFLRSWSGDTIV